MDSDTNSNTDASADPEPEPEPDTAPRPEVVQESQHFYHVRVRPEDEFTEFRTPLAEEDDSTELPVEGEDVREGRTDTGDWRVQSVLVPLDAVADAAEAERVAAETVDSREA